MNCTVFDLINFYRRFVKGAAQAQVLLHALLTGARKRDKQPVSWTPETERAFTTCVTQLTEATLLAHPIENAPLLLRTDASDIAIGAVLEQRYENTWQPLGFYSKKLSPTETKYNTYDRELLAIFRSLKFFRYMVEGRSLTIQTDNKPLTYAFNQKAEKASPRQLRQLIGQFSTRIIHISQI